MINNIDINKVWKETTDIINLQVNQIVYDIWIKNLQPAGISGDEFILIAPYENTKNLINKNYKGIIDSALLSVCPFLKGINVITENDIAVAHNIPSMPDDVTEEYYNNYESEETFFEEKYTFDNFVIGGSNEIAFAAAKAVADDPGVKHNPLFIYGGVGLGKTHIMHAVGNNILKKSPNKKIIYVNTESFINDFIDSITKAKNNDLNKQFRDKYRSVDVLMLDDIQFISGKTTTQEALFHTFNELYQSKKQIVFSSDCHPRELNNIDDRLKSRFQSGLTVDISSPDIETRIAILKRKSFQNRFNVSNEVLNYIAERINTNIRELEGALSKVKFYCDLNKINADDIDVVKKALKDEIDNKNGPISMGLITNCVCDYFTIEKNEMMSKKKTKRINDARQVSIFLISELMPVPLVTIGDYFGGRDHSTIIHARDKISALVNDNPQYATYIKDIKHMISIKKN